MTSPSWERVKQVFQETVDRTPDERLARARELCGDDHALLAKVESCRVPRRAMNDDVVAKPDCGRASIGCAS